MREEEEDQRESESEGSYEEIKQPAQEMPNLSEDELARYGTYRTTGFNKGGVRKLVLQTLNQTCNPNFVIVLSAIGKAFVSELIEEAKEVQEEWGDAGDLLPSHVHEGYRRLYHKMPNMSSPGR